MIKKLKRRQKETKEKVNKKKGKERKQKEKKEKNIDRHFFAQPHDRQFLFLYSLIRGNGHRSNVDENLYFERSFLKLEDTLTRQNVTTRSSYSLLSLIWHCSFKL